MTGEMVTMGKVKIAAVILAVISAAGLAACGGNGSSAAGSEPPAAAQIARQIGATDVQAVTPPTLYAYDEATATLHGRAVDIATFRTDTLRDNWVQIASQYAGIVQAGHLYAVADAADGG